MLFLGPPVGTKRQFPASQKRFPTPFGIPMDRVVRGIQTASLMLPQRPSHSQEVANN